jgi:superfamily II DNA or RNA helicase
LKWGGRGIVWCAPGFGKTELAMGAIKTLMDRGLIKNALFVCSGLDAVTQTTERMKKQLPDYKSIKITNIQALARSLKNREIAFIQYLQDLDFLIIDECHHQRASEFRKLVALYRGKYRLGISASPFHEYQTNIHAMRSDDGVVLRFLGPVVSRYSASTLIEKDRLAKPIIFLYPLPVDKIQMPLFPTWHLSKRMLLTENHSMHNVIARFVKTAAEAEEQSLVVAGGIKKLAFNVWKALDRRDVNAKFLHGSIDKQYRNWTRKKLIKGEIDAICATTIYDEAVDLPNLRLLALAYGGLSSIKLEQRIGRDLRRKQGQNIAVILDFVCTTNKHLKKHSYARLKHYLAERAFEFKLVGNHSQHVRNLFKDRAEFIDELPGVEFFRELKANGDSRT